MSNTERYAKAIKSCEEQLQKLHAQLEEANAMPVGVAREYVINNLRSEISTVEDERETFQWALSQE
ncbi:hypothetical protein AB0P21_20935 [Kribbella sp. NPDC056861]|uniref:hypothetical protein n=1 Tax=Kribbella sp. NPDC056861 TaxID=3154857 RepID=UPI00343EFD71